jgi:hypothetical protein
MRPLAIAFLVLPLAAACGPNAGSGGDDDDDDGVDARPDADPFAPDAALPADVAKVYAHSAGVLYQVDPDTLAITEVGPFQWSTGGDQMTDIAIDKDGNMIGISFTRVYAVNKTTAQATYLADLDQDFNGLSFVPIDAIDPTSEERLVAAANSGSIYEVDPQTGLSTPIGDYGGVYGSSGDIVSVRSFGTVATITGASLQDSLARLDGTSFAATPVGNTGYNQVWGLGFWEDKVFGFTETGNFILINPNTGAATVASTNGILWWGAAVTTSAPVVE